MRAGYPNITSNGPNRSERGVEHLAVVEVRKPTAHDAVQRSEFCVTQKMTIPRKPPGWGKCPRADLGESPTGVGIGDGSRSKIAFSFGCSCTPLISCLPRDSSLLGHFGRTHLLIPHMSLFISHHLHSTFAPSGSPHDDSRKHGTLVFLGTTCSQGVSLIMGRVAGRMTGRRRGAWSPKLIKLKKVLSRPALVDNRVNS